MMVSKQALGIALSLSLSAVSGQGDLNVNYFESLLTRDQDEVVYQEGPFKMESYCEPSSSRPRSSDVGLTLTIENTSDEDMFITGKVPNENIQNGGEIDDHVLASGEVFIAGVIWRESHVQQAYQEYYGSHGGVWVYLNGEGNYIGWDGASIVGIHEDDDDVRDVLGGSHDCVVAGTFNTVVSKGKKKKGKKNMRK